MLKSGRPGCTCVTTKIIAVGIGDDISKDELNDIASEPVDDNVILVDDFNSLGLVEEQLRVAICGGQ